MILGDFEWLLHGIGGAQDYGTTQTGYGTTPGAWVGVGMLRVIGIPLLFMF